MIRRSNTSIRPFSPLEVIGVGLTIRTAFMGWGKIRLARDWLPKYWYEAWKTRFYPLK